jgi:hypothetical protein
MDILQRGRRKPPRKGNQMNRQCERCEKDNMDLDHDCVLDLEEIIEVRNNKYESIKQVYDLNAYFCFTCADKTIMEIEANK